MAGIDLYTSDPAETFEDLTDLGALCPGCQVIGDPIITLKGVPLEGSPACPGEDLGRTDTVIRRIGDTPPLNPGEDAQIPIEIVALHLQSIQPIQVDCSGETQQWMLDVTIEPSQQQPGQMRIFKTHPNGGNFQSVLPVTPIFTFSRINIEPPQVVCEVEGPFRIYNANAPWVHDPSPLPILEIPGCTSNFVPGVDPSFGLAGDPVLVGVLEISPIGRIFLFPTPDESSGAPDPYADPTSVRLSNAPNPFSGNTTIRFHLDDRAHVRVSVYDVLGRTVRTLADGPVSQGSHSVPWDGLDDAGRPVVGGVYAYEVQADGLRSVRKMIHLK